MLSEDSIVLRITSGENVLKIHLTSSNLPFSRSRSMINELCWDKSIVFRSNSQKNGCNDFGIFCIPKYRTRPQRCNFDLERITQASSGVVSWISIIGSFVSRLEITTTITPDKPMSVVYGKFLMT